MDSDEYTERLGLCFLYAPFLWPFWSVVLPSAVHRCGFWALCLGAERMEVNLERGFVYRDGPKFCWAREVRATWTCDLPCKPMTSVLNHRVGMLGSSWLRHCATSRKVAGSIPYGVFEIFCWFNRWHVTQRRLIATDVGNCLTSQNIEDILK